jgi:hypothetical protein
LFGVEGGKAQRFGPARAFFESTQVFESQRKAAIALYNLYGRTVLKGEGSPQALVPPYNFVQNPIENRSVQRTFQFEHQRDVIGRKARLQAIQKPEAPLREGNRKDVRLKKPGSGPVFAIVRICRQFQTSVPKAHSLPKEEGSLNE